MPLLGISNANTYLPIKKLVLNLILVFHSFFFFCIFCLFLCYVSSCSIPTYFVILQDADECRRFLKEEFGKPYSEGVRAHRSLHDFAESNYLAHLSFVRTNSKM